MSRLSLLSLLFAFVVTTPLAAQSLQGMDVSGLVEEMPSSALIDATVPNPAVPAEVGSGSSPNGSSPEPFGANLFHGGFSNDREDGLNPGYVIQPGDSIAVRIWGAVEFNKSLPVDARGNIFIPRVGPVPVAGTRNSGLNNRVTAAVRSVYTDNVRVYTSLNGSQPVAVFVTGFVPNPGRFSGIPSNSALHFIDRAGGIDNRRGSYRDIRILRDGKAIASLDLYDFLLDGVMPDVQFRDGDTIVVGERGAVVTVGGDVANKAIFELGDETLRGERVAEAAMLEPGVTHVGVSGVRESGAIAVYLPLAEFDTFALRNGDRLTFKSDLHDEIIVVEVEGSHLGPSRYAVPRDTRLQDLLDHIAVDPLLADVESLSLRRRSVAERQRKAIDESLRRLESRYLQAGSQTDEEARIRSQEAELIREFVQRAREVEPIGRLVVSREGEIADILLQQGDVVSIPRKSDSVLLSGEILVTQAVLYEKGLRARDYIAAAGGFTDQALKNRIVVMHPNGDVTTAKNPAVSAGDEIVVLPKVPSKNLQLSSVVVDILYKIAIATRVALDI